MAGGAKAGPGGGTIAGYPHYAVQSHQTDVTLSPNANSGVTFLSPEMTGGFNNVMAQGPSSP